MNNNEYTQFMSKVTAPSDAVQKAVDRIYEEKKSATITQFKPRGKRHFGLAVAAAALCLVVLSGVVFFPFGGGAENNFVITAGATEINNYELTKLGKLKCESNGIGTSFDEDGSVNAITVCDFLNFPINCTGEDIESVTYKMKGKGFFALPAYAGSVYDEVTLDESTDVADYNRLLLEGVLKSNDCQEALSTFTTDYPTRVNGLMLCLYTGEDNGPYCEEYNNTELKEEDGVSHGKGFDYQQMFYELFSAEEYSVEITANFKDGTAQTKAVDLVIEKEGQDSEYEFFSTITVSAKLAQ